MKPSIAFRHHHRVSQHESVGPVNHYRIVVANRPLNLWLEISGPGTGIRLLRQGSHDFHSYAELAKTLVRPGMSDLEKAVAVYRFSAGNFYSAGIGFGGTEMTRFLNAYGYAFCWGQADFQHLLYEAVGLRARAPRLKGHSSVEVLIDGKWRMLDAFMRLIVPARELDGLATGDELHRHPELWERSRVGKMVDTAKDYWSEHSPADTYEPWQDSRAMLLNLRRGESLRFFYGDPVAYCFSPQKPADHANGQWTWTPTLDAQHIRTELESCENVQAVPDGLGLADRSRSGTVEYLLHSPHPLCTGNGALSFGGSCSARVSVSTDRRKTWTVLHDGSISEASWKLDAQLTMAGVPAPYDHSVLTRTEKCDVLLRVEWRGAAWLQSVQLEFFTQVHAPSIPRLQQGMNQWTLIGCEEGGSVRHAWDEYPDLGVSNAFPHAGEEVEIAATVHNRNPKPAGNVPVRFTQAGTDSVLGTVVIPAISAGGSATATLKWNAAIVGDRPPQGNGLPGRYVHSIIQAEVGAGSENEWSAVAKSIVTVRPRPVPRFCDALVWSSDERHAVERSLILRAALVHLPENLDGVILYLSDIPLTATLVPYLGHPDEGGVPLSTSRRLRDIRPSEFGVAEWEISTVTLPDQFTLWVEVQCDDPVLPEHRRLLAKRQVSLAAG